MKDAKRIAKKVRELRKGKGWSQTELARRTGMHRQGIAKIEKGEMEHGSTAETLVKLAQVLEVEVSELTGKARPAPRWSVGLLVDEFETSSMALLINPAPSQDEIRYLRTEAFARYDGPEPTVDTVAHALAGLRKGKNWPEFLKAWVEAEGDVSPPR